MKKNIIAMLAAIFLAVGMVSGSAFAAGSSTPQLSTNKTVYNLGETMYIQVTDSDSDILTTTDQTVTVTITATGTSASATKTLTNNDLGAAGANAVFGGTAGDDAAGGSAFGVTFSTAAFSSTNGGAGVSAVVQVLIPDTITITFTGADGDAASITRQVTYSDGVYTGSTASVLKTNADTTGVTDSGGNNIFTTAEVTDSADADLLPDYSNMTLYLSDQDLNTNSAAADTVTVDVATNIGGSAVTLKMNETAVNSGVFYGYVAAVHAGTTTFTTVTAANGDQSLGAGANTAAVVVISSTVADSVSVSYTDTKADGTSGKTSLSIPVILGTAGTVSVDKSSYNNGDKVKITVTDADLNLSSLAVDTIAVATDNQTLQAGEVFVTTTVGGEADEFVLTETGLNTGVFTNSIDLDPTDITTTGTYIKAVASDVIVVTYQDANDGDSDTANDAKVATAAYSTATGTIAMSPSTGTNGTVFTVNITDQDLNTSSTSVQSYASNALHLTSGGSFTIASSTGSTTHDTEGGVGGLITFTETAADSGVFQATVTLNVPTVAGSNNGTFTATNGDSITATYTEETNVAGVAATATASAIVSTTTALFSLDQASYDVNDTVTVSLTDADLDTNSTTKQTYTGTTVQVKTTADGTYRNVAITETEVNSGVFTGSFTLATASSAAGTALMTEMVAPGNTITVQYVDNGTTTLTTTATVLAHTGSIELNKTAFNLADTVEVTVVDPDLNVSATIPDTNTTLVTLKSSTDTTTVPAVTLTETGADTGIFVGTFKTSSVSGSSAAGIIQVADGDGVSVTYADAANVSGSSATATATGIAAEKVAVITLDAATYALGSSVKISMDEIDANTSAVAVNTVSVSVRSTSDPVGITVTLLETGVDTGIFEKTITVKGTASVNESVIKAAETDTITVKYSDTTDHDPVSTLTVVEGTATVEAAAAFTASTTTVSTVAGSTSEVTFTGGVAPYSITTPPSASVATAVLSGSSMNITGVGAGTADLVISDSSATPSTITVSITVAPKVVVDASAPGRVDSVVTVDTYYDTFVNTTPKSGDTPAQEWIIIGGVNNVSGAVWYFAYNGTTFELADSAAGVFSGTLTTPTYRVHPNLNLAALGYTAAAGGNLWVAYAYTTV